MSAADIDALMVLSAESRQAVVALATQWEEKATAAIVLDDPKWMPCSPKQMQQLMKMLRDQADAAGSALELAKMEKDRADQNKLWLHDAMKVIADLADMSWFQLRAFQREQRKK